MPNMTAILDMIEKGISIASTLIAAEQKAEPALAAVLSLVTKAKDGTVTRADIEATRKTLDDQIADFNAPMD